MRPSSFRPFVVHSADPPDLRQIRRDDGVVTVKLSVADCANCGVVFAITTDLEKERREDGKAFYCPNGHTLAYGGEITKLRKKLASAEQDAKYYRDATARARQDAERESRRGAAARGVVTRMRRRAVAGACQFCNRTFADVQRHLVTKHPTETAALPPELEA